MCRMFLRWQGPNGFERVFNLAKCLELALNDGLDRLTNEQLGPRTGDPTRFTSFEEVVAAFKAQVAHFVDMKVHYDNIMRDIYAVYCPVPFTSAVIDDCIERALDWHRGGAHYNIATMSGVAVGTVADAMSAIRKHVFDEKNFTMGQLKEALDRDWQGFELMRQLLVNKTPHYGNDDDYADDLAVLVAQIFCDESVKGTVTSRERSTGSICCPLLRTFPWVSRPAPPPTGGYM